MMAHFHQSSSFCVTILRPEGSTLATEERWFFQGILSLLTLSFSFRFHFRHWLILFFHYSSPFFLLSYLTLLLWPLCCFFWVFSLVYLQFWYFFLAQCTPHIQKGAEYFLLFHISHILGHLGIVFWIEVCFYFFQVWF